MEAARSLEALDGAITSDAALLTDIDRPILEDARNLLVQAMQGDNAQAIHEAVEHLENAALPFIQRRMNQAVSRALAGHSVDEMARHMQR